MIGCPRTTLIWLPAEKMRQLCIHHGRKILPNCFLDIATDHFEKFLRPMLNLIEDFYYFRYADFQFHGTSPFVLIFGYQNLYKEKCLFLPFKIHTKFYTS